MLPVGLSLLYHIKELTDYFFFALHSRQVFFDDFLNGNYSCLTAAFAVRTRQFPKNHQKILGSFNAQKK